eukprot:TRINITY_DN1206_c0_g1_i1.p3 TRINITY_DN1206_c0_g1~~TRINITY_DN1206_c0_g1_i1.p3  ORF type:complete len:123 (-),score=24.66 TRINITY_DN1206_c0_g1_i1:1028-1396(-)
MGGTHQFLKIENVSEDSVWTKWKDGQPQSKKERDIMRICDFVFIVKRIDNPSALLKHGLKKHSFNDSNLCLLCSQKIQLRGWKNRCTSASHKKRVSEEYWNKKYRESTETELIGQDPNNYGC